MLIRGLAVLAIVASSLGFMGGADAEVTKAAEPPCLFNDWHGKVCPKPVAIHGKNVDLTGQTPGVTTKPEPVTAAPRPWQERCPDAWELDAPNPCNTSYGWWSNENSCYMQPRQVDAELDGYKGELTYLDGSSSESINDPVTVDLSKEIPYDCHLTPEITTIVAVPISKTSTDGATAARTVIARMRLQPVGIGLNPDPAEKRMGFVGWPQWVWVSNPGPRTLGPISSTVAGVTATAKVDKVVWDLGDGTKLTCNTPAGTPPTAAVKYGKRGTSPTRCSHIYEEASRHETGGKYTISATSFWTVAWRSPTARGTLTTSYTARRQLTVGEIQVLVSG